MAEILVIKYSALGDMVMATGAFQAIRAHHLRDRITLLTTRPYVNFGEATGLFDAVLVDTRPKAWRVGRWWSQLQVLRGGRFVRVYDLQRNQRTSILYRLMRAGRPDLEWSGVVPGCSHHVPARRDEAIHFTAKLAEQLRAAGIELVPPPDLSWLGGEQAFDLPRPYALLAPGAAPTRPEKRAPAGLFAAIGIDLLAQGITPVLIGTKAERAVLAEVAAACPGAVDLCDRTTLGDVAALARGAVVGIGNDTGPMHLMGTAGCPVVVLFSAASDPHRIAPRGPAVRVLQRPNLAHLEAAEVLAEAEAATHMPHSPAARQP